jgi:hypothetical protein
MMSPGVRVLPSDFNSKTDKISPKDAAYPEKNRLIQRLLLKMETAVRDTTAGGQPVTSKAVGATLGAIEYRGKARSAV